MHIDHNMTTKHFQAAEKFATCEKIDTRLHKNTKYETCDNYTVNL
jgi:hypothetical protein